MAPRGGKERRTRVKRRGWHLPAPCCRALQAGSGTPGDAADEEDGQDGAGVLPSREQLQAYLSEMLLSPMDGEEEVDRDLPQYASLEECAEALKQCGIGLRSAHQQLFPAAV